MPFQTYFFRSKIARMMQHQNIDFGLQISDDKTTEIEAQTYAK